MNKKIIIVSFISIVAVLFIFLDIHPFQRQENQTNVVEIGSTEIPVEVVKRTEDLEQGLSGRESLNENKGMLFVLPERKIASFWMKDMKFSIDIIWIDDEEVVYIVEDAGIPTTSNIPTYKPDRAATHVLEVNSGFVKKHELKVGDKVTLQISPD